ncbi:RDD family protein [Agathobaculum desmolans]|uniref:RDD family protein n=1 Tax=Agathobaculum desmolans TaxID=39484 RepID=UPI0004E19C76|nr:RDD family protein [Agathobaculum desmolans]
MNTSAVGPFRRLAAYAIDWYLATMLCGAPLMLINSMRTGLAAMDSSIPPGRAGWLWGGISILCGLFYYWLIPLLWNGQTPGKRLLHLRIVCRETQQPAGAAALALRQIVGMILLEGAICFPSQLLRELIARAAGEDVANIVRIAMVAVTILSVMLGLYTPNRRMLHDRISGTMEICEKTT